MSAPAQALFDEVTIHARQAAAEAARRHTATARMSCRAALVVDLARALDQLTLDVLDEGERRRAFSSLGAVSAWSLNREEVELCSGSFGLAEEDALQIALKFSEVLDQNRDKRSISDLLNVIGSEVQCSIRGFNIALAKHFLARVMHEELPPPVTRDLVRRALFALQQVSTATSLGEVFSEVMGTSDPWVKMDLALVERCSLVAESSVISSNWNVWMAAPAGRRLVLAGRITGLRGHKRTVFADLQGDGCQAQVAFNVQSSSFASDVRTGDYIRVRGSVEATRTGTLTLFVDELLAHEPCLTEQPESYDAVQLVHQAESLQATRDLLQRLLFKEVITRTVTDDYHGGASRPFATWQSGRDCEGYLRVTSELALTQAIAAGVSRVYELAPSFRNEGLHGRVTAEFSLLEGYASDLSLDAMAEVAQTLILAVLRDSAGRFERRSYAELFETYTGMKLTDEQEIRARAQSLGLSAVTSGTSTEVLVHRLFRKIVEPQMTGCIAITEIPGPGSPLITGKGVQARRIWLYVNGTDVAEVAENERDVNLLRSDFMSQFASDRFLVRRDYRDVLRTYAQGIPRYVGFGIGFTRLLKLSLARSRQDGVSL